MSRPSLISIHDVMPATFSGVRRILKLARQYGHQNLTLLVVPGREWTPSDVDQLRAWVDEGCELAGHGWYHKCASIRGWRHWAHSRLISRDVAEHLAVTPEECIELIFRCGEWFEKQHLSIPDLYVPPAWAMGDVDVSGFQDFPFTMFELLTGVLDAPSGTFRRLLLVGFEADTVFREYTLRWLNTVNRCTALLADIPIRVAFHPCDLELRLRYTVDEILKDSKQIRYEDLRRKSITGPNPR